MMKYLKIMNFLLAYRVPYRIGSKLRTKRHRTVLLFKSLKNIIRNGEINTEPCRYNRHYLFMAYADDVAVIPKMSLGIREQKSKCMENGATIEGKNFIKRVL